MSTGHKGFIVVANRQIKFLLSDAAFSNNSTPSEQLKGTPSRNLWGTRQPRHFFGQRAPRTAAAAAAAAAGSFYIIRSSGVSM